MLSNELLVAWLRQSHLVPKGFEKSAYALTRFHDRRDLFQAVKAIGLEKFLALWVTAYKKRLKVLGFWWFFDWIEA